MGVAVEEGRRAARAGRKRGPRLGGGAKGIRRGEEPRRSQRDGRAEAEAD